MFDFKWGLSLNAPHRLIVQKLIVRISLDLALENTLPKDPRENATKLQVASQAPNQNVERSQKWRLRMVPSSGQKEIEMDVNSWSKKPKMGSWVKHTARCILKQGMRSV